MILTRGVNAFQNFFPNANQMKTTILQLTPKYFKYKKMHV